MPTQIQWRRGNTAQTAAFTGALAEITVDTDKKTLVVHDGVTAGGYALALESAQQDALAYAKANGAYDKANTANIIAQGAFNKVNVAFDVANTKFNSAGGTISGDVLVSGNVTPTSDNDKYLGSPTYRWHTLYVGPGSIDIDGIKIQNTAGKLVVTGATDFTVPGAPSTASISAHANAAFDTANTALLSTGAFAQANAAFNKANTAYDQAIIGTNIAGLAFNKANSGSGIATSGFAQANLAYDKANSAYELANNVAPQVQPAFDKANSAFDFANTRFASAGGTVSGFVNITSNVSVGTSLSVGSYIDMNTVPAKPSYTEGRVFYDNEQKALAYYNESSMTGQILQESVIRVHNQTGSEIGDGKAVYITGPSSANGFPSVALANSAFYESSEVIGITTTVIANSGYGYVTSMGKVNGIDTHLVTEGSEVYLSDTEPGGWTTTPPAPPSIPVRLGIVAVSDVTDGSILVDVTFRDGSNKTTGAILFAYDKTIHEDPENFFYDHVNHRLGIGTNVPAANLHVAGDALFTGNVQIDGNLIISNAQSISTSTLVVGGNLIVLNDTTTGSPVSNAEIRVNRGESSNVFIKWDEQIEEWIMYEGTYNAGHILHSEKTAHTWADYSAMATYEKLTHPIGASLANSINEIAKTAFDQANTGLGIALSGFDQANLAYTQANSAYDLASNVAPQVQPAYDKANNAYDKANSAYDLASNVAPQVQPAFDKANSAYEFAGLAYDEANTKVSKSGDTMSGDLIVPTLTANSSVTINTVSNFVTSNITTSSTSEVVLHSFDITEYRSAKYFVQISSDTSFHSIEIGMLHDDTTVFMNQYGEITTNISLGTFDSTITLGVAKLLFTPANSVTTIKTAGTLITV